MEGAAGGAGVETAVGTGESVGIGVAGAVGSAVGALVASGLGASLSDAVARTRASAVGFLPAVELPVKRPEKPRATVTAHIRAIAPKTSGTAALFRRLPGVGAWSTTGDAVRQE